MSKAKFKTGELVMTAAAQATIHPGDMILALGRHIKGDWGDCCPEDKEVNEESLKGRGRLMSIYKDTSGKRFWIITEWDRSVTTVLLPEDY